MNSLSPSLVRTPSEPEHSLPLSSMDAISSQWLPGVEGTNPVASPQRLADCLMRLGVNAHT